MSEIDLSNFRMLVEAEANADTARRFHLAEAKKYERVRDQCREQLEKVMGVCEVGLIDGKEVLGRKLSEQFAPARFRTEHPDIAEDYIVQKITDELDVDRLRKDLPDLAAQYFTTKWTNNWGLL